MCVAALCVQLDATENTATARRFNVRGYPTVKMLSNGKQYAFEGKRSKKTILEWATVREARFRL